MKSDYQCAHSGCGRRWRMGESAVPSGTHGRPPTAAALLLILGPRLLSALALEHADGPAIHGIEHPPNHGGILAANAARPDRIGIEAGKDFVLELATH
jgi:hypothetical protein